MKQQTTTMRTATITITLILAACLSKTLKGQAFGKDTTHLDFVGAGNVQRSLDNGEGLPASTGLGVVLDEYHRRKQIFGGTVDRVRFSGQINVANTDDSLSVVYGANGPENPSQVGEAIMTPLVGRRAVDLDLMVFFSDSVKRIKKDSSVIQRSVSSWRSLISGVQVKYTGSNRLLVDSSGSVKCTINALRIRLFHDILSREYNHDFNVLIGLGWGFNSLRGDVAQQGNDAYREHLLGTRNMFFGGLETFAMFRIKNIRAEFSYTWLDVGGNVAGLSGSRMVTTISFVGGFPVKLNPLKSSSKPGSSASQ